MLPFCESYQSGYRRRDISIYWRALTTPIVPMTVNNGKDSRMLRGICQKSATKTHNKKQRSKYNTHDEHTLLLHLTRTCNNEVFCMAQENKNVGRKEIMASPGSYPTNFRFYKQCICDVLQDPSDCTRGRVTAPYYSMGKYIYEELNNDPA